MRILHILDHSIPLHSGYSFRTREIIRHQRARGWETAHVTSTKHTAESDAEETVDGLHFYRTLPGHGLFDALPIVDQLAVVRSLARRLAMIVDEIKPDILHAHSPCLNGLAALRVARRRHLPLVYELRALWEDGAVDHGTTTPNSLRYRMSRALETYVLKRADAITTICNGLQKEITGRGINADKVTVIPNAVDVHRFTVHESRDPQLNEELDLTDKPVLGFIGSFYRYEGLSTLLDSVPQIVQASPDVRILLVGGGMEAEALHQQVKTLGIDHQVIFTGRVPHDQVDRYYSLIDILVYPRLATRLTDLVTPLKPLEAMAQGRALVASDVGGHLELIRDGETGLLFEANNPGALAEAVIKLLRDDTFAQQLRTSGRQFVEDARNWPASIERYEEAYAAARVRTSAR